MQTFNLVSTGDPPSGRARRSRSRCRARTSCSSCSARSPAAPPATTCSTSTGPSSSGREWASHSHERSEGPDGQEEDDNDRTAEVEPKALPRAPRPRACRGRQARCARAEGAQRRRRERDAGERLVPPGQARHPALLDPRLHHPTQHREQPGQRADADYGLSGRAELPGGPDRPRPARAAPGRVPGDVRVPRGPRLPGLRVLPVLQNVNELGRQPTHAEIRSYLDNAGLTSTGTHTGGLGVMYDPVTGGLSANGQTPAQIAQTLGHTMIGTAGDPTGGDARQQPGEPEPDRLDRDRASRERRRQDPRRARDALVLAHRAERLAVLQRPGPPGAVSTHRIDWWTANTDPSLVFFEPDIFHSYAGRARFPDPVDGSKWDALGFWQANTHRLVGWHVKDGTGSWSSPHLRRTRSPRRSCAHRRSPRVGSRTTTLSTPARDRSGRAIRSTPILPSSASRGSSTTSAHKGAKFFILETDSGIGPATDPGRSLRHAKLGIEYLLGLRAGPSTHASHGVEDETVFESDLELAG